MNATREYFWPQEPDKKLIVLERFNAAMTPALQTKYNVSADDLLYLAKAEKALRYLLGVMQVAVNWSESVTERRDSIFSLPFGTVLDMPVGPVIPALPLDGLTPMTTFECGLNEVMARVAAEIKGKQNYDVADGDLLGIEGVLVPPPEAATTKPVLKHKIVTGGCPELGVKLSPFKSWELWADFGTGTFVMCGVALKSKLVCEHALPPAGQSAVWKFKAIYRDGNAQFGQFSDVVSVPVAGV
ncbi:MAG: hypothetical protein RL088_3836 [Verrucomicrobiota bacterium]|jgi:hypothetical protein